MKRTGSLIAGALLLTGVGIAAAQEVVIAPEQRVVIREYVIAHPVEPIPMIDGVQIGQILPPEVTLYPIDSPDMTFSYVVMDGRTLIVEPQSRQIVDIIE